MVKCIGFRGIPPSHDVDGLKAQRVHSRGKANGVGATSWVAIHPAWCPLLGAKVKNTLLVISDSYLQYRTFALYRAHRPSSPTQGAAPNVACRWAMDSLPPWGASRAARTPHSSLFHKASLPRSLAVGLWTLSLSGNIRVTA